MRHTTLTLLLGLALSLLLAPAGRAAGDSKTVAGRTRSEWLKMLLKEKELKKRRAAVIALEVFGPKADQVLQGLTIALEKDASPVIRRQVAAALGRMGADAKSTLPALTTALTDDKDGSVREAAARALEGLVPHSRVAVAELARALKDSYPPTRTAAVSVLKELAAEARPAMPHVLELLKGGGDKNNEPLARVYAVQIVGRLALADKAVPLLTAVVGDTRDDSQVRTAAAVALERYGPKAESASARLAEVAADAKADTGLRQKALTALGRVSPDARAVWPAVRKVLADKNSGLRGQAVRVAGPLGKQEKEVIPQLEKMAREDGNVEVRVAAIQELGVLGPAAKAAEKTLTKLANDPRASIRDAAVEALKLVRAGATP
jgi:HEAT repeat protein